MRNPPFVYSKTGLALTESIEGLRLTSYTDIRGVWTIGYGHTGTILWQGEAVPIGPGMTITREYAENLLAADIHWAANAVNRLVDYEINQSEFDALVDFVFNAGVAAFADSTLLKLLNKGDVRGAAEQFDEWDHAGGQAVAGLLRRRVDETREFEQVAS